MTIAIKEGSTPYIDRWTGRRMLDVTMPIDKFKRLYGHRVRAGAFDNRYAKCTHVRFNLRVDTGVAYNFNFLPRNTATGESQ